MILNKKAINYCFMKYNSFLSEIFVNVLNNNVKIVYTIYIVIQWKLWILRLYA